MMNGSLSENGKHPVGRSTTGQWGKRQCSISASPLTQRIWCGRRNVSPFERPSGHRQSIIRRQVLVNIIQSLSSSTQETATKTKIRPPPIHQSLPRALISRPLWTHLLPANSNQHGFVCIVNAFPPPMAAFLNMDLGNGCCGKVDPAGS